MLAQSIQASTRPAAKSSNDPAIVFLATTYSPQCRHLVDKRLDGYYTLQFMESGAVSLAYDDRSYLLEGAWFWPAYPGPLIKFHVAPGHDTWFHRHVGFRGPLVAEWIAAGLWLQEPQPMPGGGDYPALFDQIIHQARRSDRWGRLRAANLVEQLLLELAESRAQAPLGEPWIDSALLLLNSEESFSPDYGRMAAKLNIGLSTLRRRFKEATGMALHTYVLERRMARARTLLVETDLSIKAIAERLGYDNVYFFSRQFTQQARVPPGAYRQSRQG